LPASPASSASALTVGEPAPGFELPDADMELASLAEYRNHRHVVLYFYPRDDTPGCTIEAIEFSELADEFDARHAVVLGISRDDCSSHGEFRDKHGLSVRLLSDVDGETCASYGVLYEKEHDGHRKTCIQRSTFVIDKRGVLRHAAYGVNPRGHARDVLALLESLKCK
jgi:peroxiredoxin Q/BCP